jgi:hypothetical protein
METCWYHFKKESEKRETNGGDKPNQGTTYLYMEMSQWNPLYNYYILIKTFQKNKYLSICPGHHVHFSEPPERIKLANVSHVCYRTGWYHICAECWASLISAAGFRIVFILEVSLLCVLGATSGSNKLHSLWIKQIPTCSTDQRFAPSGSKHPIIGVFPNCLRESGKQETHWVLHCWERIEETEHSAC